MKSMAKFKMWLCDWLGYVFVELSLWRVFSRFYALGCWFYRYGEDIHADHADDCQCTDCGGIGYENMTDDEYYSMLEREVKPVNILWTGFPTLPLK